MRILILGGLITLIAAGLGRTAEPLKVEIIAHRGASYDAPENTIAAIQLAWEQGADGSEFDVYLTKDGQIAVIHDKDTKRTAGVNKLIAESTLDELQTLDVGTWKNTKYAGEKIPSLQDMLQTIPAGKKVFVEVKCGPEIVPQLDEALQKSGLKPTQTPVISFDAAVIAAIKKRRPDLPAYWLVGLKKETTVRLIIAKAKEIHADGLDLSANEFLTSDFARQIHAAGLRLDVWTVNDVAVARRMMELGVKSITTDRPGWLRDELRKNSG